MSKLDQIRANAMATRAAKNARSNPFEDAARGRDPQPKSSDGGVESNERAVPSTPAADEQRRHAVLKPRRLRPSARVSAESSVAEAGVAPGPSETKHRGGRPLAKDAAKALMQTKPWLAEGMSRASWYRRRKKEQAK